MHDIHPVTVHTRELTGRDSHRKPVYEDVDREALVAAWYPPTADATRFTGTRDAVIHDLDVLATTDLGVKHNDHITIAGKKYRVEGDPEDFNHGPFGYQPGYRISLFRAEERP